MREDTESFSYQAPIWKLIGSSVLIYPTSPYKSPSLLYIQVTKSPDEIDFWTFLFLSLEFSQFSPQIEKMFLSSGGFCFVFFESELLQSVLSYMKAHSCCTALLKNNWGLESISWQNRGCCSKKALALRRLHKFNSKDVMVCLYKSCVLPPLEYCSPLLLGIGNVEDNKMENFNYYLLRSIWNYLKSVSYEALLKISLRTADVFPVVASLNFWRERSDDWKYVCCLQVNL